MKYKRTEDLLEQLKKQNIKYDDYLAKNEDSFVVQDLSEYWREVIEKSNMTKVDIINKADIGYTYFYNVIGGKSIPSRDTLVKLFLSMRAGLEECQKALKLYNWSGLYPKNKRDSILIYALAHSLSLYDTEEILEDKGEKIFRTS
ncbi:MAG: hypothetical protein IJ025_00320 [Clostridia bacterium]|nr:hypothetical protein [Clostridia bacterium]